MKPVAYLSPKEDWYCPDCVPLAQAPTPEKPAPPIDPEYAPAFGDEDTDTPDHCTNCGAVLPFTPTDDCIEYVADAIIEAIVQHRPKDVPRLWFGWLNDNGYWDDLACEVAEGVFNLLFREVR